MQNLALVLVGTVEPKLEMNTFINNALEAACSLKRECIDIEFEASIKTAYKGNLGNPIANS
jgi:hypothetical protein